MKASGALFFIHSKISALDPAGASSLGCAAAWALVLAAVVLATSRIRVEDGGETGNIDIRR